MICSGAVGFVRSKVAVCFLRLSGRLSGRLSRWHLCDSISILVWSTYIWIYGGPVGERYMVTWPYGLICKR